MPRPVNIDDLPSDDEDDQLQASGPGQPSSFGVQYLKQFGWKPGDPLRAGGVVAEYAPKSEGGFAAAGGKQDKGLMVVGATVATIIGQGSGAAAGELGTITRVDAERAEVEFRDGRRALVKLAHLRHATANEEAKRGRDDAAPNGGASGAPDTRWIVKRLIVRVVEADPGAADAASFVPYKATVVSMTPGAAGGRVVLSNGSTVNGRQVDTVLPKKGERGLVVLGEHRGKLVTVRDRRKADGVVIAEVAADAPPLELRAEELCAMDFSAK